MEALKEEATLGHTSLEVAREKAAYWLLSLEDASDTNRAILEVQIDTWLKEDVKHEQIFNEMQSIWSATSHHSQKQSRFKTSILNILIIGFIAITNMQMPWQYWNAAYKTNVGEIKTILLEDGTEATLNTNTAFNIDFDGDKRVVKLVRGELLVKVAYQENQPFTVITPHGSATALGTIYSTRIQEGKTTVKVYESRVTVSLTEKPEQSAVIHSGQSATLDKQKISNTRALTEKEPDWLRKKLTFHNTPLSEVISRISYYRNGKVSAKGEVLQRDLHFTGLLPADDSDAALSVVAEALGLELHQFTDYNVWFENSSNNIQ